MMWRRSLRRPGLAGLPALQPRLARLTALPGPRGEAEDLDLDAAALQRARQDVGAGRRDGDRPAAHRAGIVEQQRHDGVAEIGVLLALEGERLERIDDDARQARRIEHALLEVELPGAVLLRHQAALQPVGEPADDALEMCELLVEIGAQPRQLVGVAEILGVDDLVELLREGLVVRAARLVGARGRRPRRFGGLLGIGVVGVVGHLAGGRIGRLGGASSTSWSASSLISISARSPCASCSASPSPCCCSCSRFVLVLVLVVLGVEGGVVGHVEGGEEIADAAGEVALILDVLQQAIEIAPGPVLDEVAPQIDDLGGGGRRFEAGQALAHHQRDRILDRRVGAVRDLLVLAAAVVAVLEHRRDVAGDAGHAARADRLDARLLDRVEDGARRLAVGREAAMHGGVVAGEPQRHRIGMAAQDRDVLRASGGAAARASGALSPMSAGRSDAKVTSRSGFRAIARMQPAIERLSGSAGASFFSPGLRFEMDIWTSPAPTGPCMTAPRSRRFPAVPCRRSAGRTPRPGGAPARRTCSGTSRGRRSRYRRRSRRSRPR